LISGKKPTINNFIKSNLTALINALEYAKKVKLKYFFYLSTITVFGDFDEKILYEDSHIKNPSIYGTSKLFGEHIVKDYSSYFKTIVLRLPGVVHYQMPSNRPWLNTIIEKFKNDQDIQVYNKNSLFNNLIDCKNLKNILLYIINSEEKENFDILNIAARKPIPLIDVLNILKDKIGSKSKIKNVEVKNKSFIISTEKLEKKYNFLPTTTTEILKSII